MIQLIRTYSKFNDLPILAVSTNPQLDEELEDLVDGFLPKPFDIDQLCVQVSKILRTSRIANKRRYTDGGDLDEEVLLQQAQALRHRMVRVRRQCAEHWERTQHLFQRNQVLVSQIRAYAKTSRHLPAQAQDADCK